MALQIAKQIEVVEQQMLCEKLISDIYSKKGHASQALFHFQKYSALKDKLINEESIRKSVESSMNYEFEKKEAVTKAEHLAQSKQQKIIILAIMVGLILVIIFSFFLYKRFKITKKQNEVIAHQKVLVDEAYKDLHEKNKEVIDSITYARRIQRALITPEAYIDKALNKLNKNS
jgi:SHS2 domain-containing protein